MGTQMLTSKSTPLAPSELMGLFQLKARGYNILEVSVSPVSSLRGQIVANVQLPEGCRILCLVRLNETIVCCEDAFLRPGDKLYVLTDNEEATRRFFLF